jgi:hypothetical protein
MDGVAGYFIDHVDGDADIYVCKQCVEKTGKSTDRPLSQEDYNFLPIMCGFHIYHGNPDNYV